MEEGGVVMEVKRGMGRKRVKFSEEVREWRFLDLLLQIIWFITVNQKRIGK